MYLFFDTETNGLPLDHRASVNNLDNWPRLVQLAWMVIDNVGNEIGSAEHIIRPNGFVIPHTAAVVHGITTEIGIKQGVDLASVLRSIEPSLQESSFIVAHNIAFDEKILGAEFLRTGYPNPMETKKRICTMKSSTSYCRLPGKQGYKWPKLSELHMELFGTGFDEAHRALADVRACARCFFELKRLGIMT